MRNVRFRHRVSQRPPHDGADPFPRYLNNLGHLDTRNHHCPDVSTPGAMDPGDPDHSVQTLWALQDANFNVLAVVDDAGVMVERYDYDPYGKRYVYRSVGSADPDLHARLHISQRVTDAGTTPIDLTYAVCDIGWVVSGIRPGEVRIYSTTSDSDLMPRLTEMPVSRSV